MHVVIQDFTKELDYYRERIVIEKIWISIFRIDFRVLEHKKVVLKHLFTPVYTLTQLKRLNHLTYFEQIHTKHVFCQNNRPKILFGKD